MYNGNFHSVDCWTMIWSLHDLCCLNPAGSSRYLLYASFSLCNIILLSILPAVTVSPTVKIPLYVHFTFLRDFHNKPFFPLWWHFFVFPYTLHKYFSNMSMDMLKSNFRSSGGITSRPAAFPYFRNWMAFLISFLVDGPVQSRCSWCTTLCQQEGCLVS